GGVDGDDEMMMVAVVLVVVVEVAARSREWYIGSYRSDDEEKIGTWPKKLTGKLFRRRPTVAEGGAVVAAGNGGEKKMHVVFGSKYFILNIKYYLTKFDPKSYEGIFLGYSQNSKAYIILNKHTMKIKESLNVTFVETSPPSKTSPLVDDDLDEDEAIKVTEKKNIENDIEDETL
ncbi:hypothetical protein Tco_0098922, partial [Tanacetum coccineum]